MFLFEQFSRASNIFFLTIILIQQISGVSPTGRYSTLIPLTIVLLATALKEILEDRKRHISDQELNNTLVSVLRNGAFVPMRWCDLRPGDVLRVKNEEFFPADCILLSSSEPQGLCYVETSNLDGETNLKLKTASALTRSYVKPSDYSYLRSKITCEQPNNRLYNFFGNLLFQTLDTNYHQHAGQLSSQSRFASFGHDSSSSSPGNPFLSPFETDPANPFGHQPSLNAMHHAGHPAIQRDALGPSALLLRGSQLKNTVFVYAVVTYTGKDTKLMRNMTPMETKLSHVNKQTNKLVYMLFVLLVCISLFSAIIYITIQSNIDHHWYLDIKSLRNKRSRFLDFILTFLTFVILYTNLIPISLILNVEMVKYVQALVFIKNDKLMHDKLRNIPANARTSSLNEDLGSVNYVFTDKTGTLTRNIMKLKYISVAGKVYGQTQAEKLAAATLAAASNNSINNDPSQHPASQVDTEVIAAAGFGSPESNEPSLPPPYHSIVGGPPLGGRYTTNDPFSNPLHEAYGSRNPNSSNTFYGAYDEQYVTESPDSEFECPDEDEGDLSPEQTFHDSELLDDLIEVGNQRSLIIRQFLTHLAVCHTVMPEVSKVNPDKIVYQAQSPDEGALVNAVKNLGFSFNVRTPESITINIMGRDETYDILKVLEFTSDRKRMSVIVRTPQNKIQIFCKGADSVIFERLSAEAQPFRKKTLNDLKAFAEKGLRTLCLATAGIPEQDYVFWEEQYDKAWRSSINREKTLEKACESIETNLFLLGATAIEDKLQFQVPETLQSLLLAGIKVWMLTGDKQETAINIGYSCGLFEKTMDIIVCSKIASYEYVDEWISANLESLGLSESGAPLTDQYSQQHRLVRGEAQPGILNSVARFFNISGTAPGAGPSLFGAHHQDDDILEPTKNVGLVIDGSCLSYALMPVLREKFVILAAQCKAVICCRAMPIQKADLVSSVRDYKPDAIILAIGDGANDVGMIQRAHVGVGISGQEGLQAVRSADYSIAQFRFLKRLLFVHGQLSLRRTSKLILFSFYKNICLYMIEFFYAFVSNFSGQPLLDAWLISLYNIFFTALPTLCLGILDRPLKNSTLLQIPQLYRIGQSGACYNVKLAWNYIFTAILHSFLIFVVHYMFYSHEVISKNGFAISQWVLGQAVYTSIILIALFKCFTMFDSHNKVTFASFGISLLIYVIVLAIYSRIWPAFGWDFGVNIYGTFEMTLGNAYFLTTCAIISITSFAISVFFNGIRRYRFPNDLELVQEMEALHRPLADAKSLPAFSWHQVLEKASVLNPFISTGFAFSQEERNLDTSVGQSDLVKIYDTNVQKPSGA